MDVKYMAGYYSTKLFPQQLSLLVTTDLRHLGYLCLQNVLLNTWGKNYQLYSYMTFFSHSAGIRTLKCYQVVLLFNIAPAATINQHHHQLCHRRSIFENMVLRIFVLKMKYRRLEKIA
jgi:hypothetical protein